MMTVSLSSQCQLTTVGKEMKRLVPARPNPRRLATGGVASTINPSLVAFTAAPSVYLHYVRVEIAVYVSLKPLMLH